MRIADVVFDYDSTITSFKELEEKREATIGHHAMLSQKAELHVIRIVNTEQTVTKNRATYYLCRGRSSKYWLPISACNIIRNLHPDLIIAHGFFHPLQLLLLRLYSSAPILLQYHGGSQPYGITGAVQRFANRYIHGFIFTSLAQAGPFIDSKFISANKALFQIMEGSNHFIRKANVNIPGLTINGRSNLIWVGNLDKNKDPLTVLRGFAITAKKHENAHLYMIYRETTLEKEAKELVAGSVSLKDRVHFVGNANKKEIGNYLSAGHYFVLGSHYEGSGFALCEAMASGCVPVVTDIPSFRAMTKNGSLGHLWQPDDAQSLADAINIVMQRNWSQESNSCTEFFHEELSFDAIASKVLSACEITIKASSR